MSFDESRASHAARFVETYCRHTKGRWAGKPLILEPWQRNEIVSPLFGTVGADGARQYREALIGLARKNGKSMLASALALYLLVADGEPGAEVYSAAGDREQARIVFNQARAIVLRSPFLHAVCRVWRDVIEVPETESLYRCLSADAPLKHGLNVHAAVIDELHVQKNPELYYALRTATGARAEPLIVNITTAGFDEKTICFERYQHGLRGEDPRFFFYWRGASEDDALDDPASWHKANPASWRTDEAIGEDLESGLPENVLRRLYLNQWTRSEERWIPLDRWDACGGAAEIPEGANIVAAIDAAPKHDTTAVSFGYKDSTGVIQTRTAIFRAPEGGVLDFDILEAFVRDLARVYNLVECRYDPYHMTRSALMLRDEGIPMVEFPQSDARMVPASQALFNAVLDGRLRHGGDPELRDQADAAAAKETSRGWRLHKLKATRPIDGIVALAMLADRLENVDGALEPRIFAI